MLVKARKITSKKLIKEIISSDTDKTDDFMEYYKEITKKKKEERNDKPSL